MKNTANSIQPILYPRNCDNNYDIIKMYSEGDDVVYLSAEGQGTEIRQGKFIRNVGEHALILQKEPYGECEYRVHANRILTPEGIPVFSMTLNDVLTRYKFTVTSNEGVVTITIRDTKNVFAKPIQYNLQ